MRKNEIKLFEDKAFGVRVSEYGLKNGYLDYAALAKILGASILNNSIIPYLGWDEWDLVNGCEENEDGWYEVYQYYIITEFGATLLSELTDEIVYYHSEIDMYVWGITHFGTGWDYVLTDVKLV